MKNLFFLTLALGIPTLSLADEVDRIREILNSNSKFDHVRAAATGKDRFAGRMAMAPYIPALCQKADCHSNDTFTNEDAAIALAKIRLKNIDESNKRYAQALVDLQKLLQSCSKEVDDVYALKNPESCVQSIRCEGKDIKKIIEAFDERDEFEKSVPKVHRELSPDEKVVAGVDISPALKVPFQDEGVQYHLDYEPVRFDIAPTLYSSRRNENHKPLFSSKLQQEIKTSLKFDDGGVPDGIMTLRGLECGTDVLIEGEQVKKDEVFCQLYVGNKNLSIQDARHTKSCLPKEEKEEKEEKEVKKEKEELGFFAKLFGKKVDKNNVNDSERSNIKDVESETKKPESKSSKSSEQ